MCVSVFKFISETAEDNKEILLARHSLCSICPDL